MLSYAFVTLSAHHETTIFKVSGARCIMKIYFVFKVTPTIIIVTGHRQTKKKDKCRFFFVGWLTSNNEKRPTPNKYNNNLNGISREKLFFYLRRIISLFSIDIQRSFVVIYIKILFYCCALSVPLMVLLVPFFGGLIMSPVGLLILCHHPLLIPMRITFTKESYLLLRYSSIISTKLENESESSYSFFFC